MRSPVAVGPFETCSQYNKCSILLIFYFIIIIDKLKKICVGLNGIDFGSF